MVKYRALVIDDGIVTHTDTFDMLCDASQFCLSRSTRGTFCKITEVIQSLTGEETVSTITSWDFVRDLANG